MNKVNGIVGFYPIAGDFGVHLLSASDSDTVSWLWSNEIGIDPHRSDIRFNEEDGEAYFYADDICIQFADCIRL